MVDRRAGWVLKRMNPVESVGRRGGRAAYSVNVPESVGSMSTR
jgi:hypothetical protein